MRLISTMDVYKAFLILLLVAVETEAPRKETTGYMPSKNDEPSTDHIPIYSKSTSTTYALEKLPDGWFMQFYSKNLFPAKPPSREGTIRDQQQLEFVMNAHYSVNQGVRFMEAIQQAARDDIKVYADLWHGKMQSEHHKAYKVTEDKMKQLRSDRRGTTYQLVARMKTTDGSLQMCCNVIINVKWERGFSYSYHCAEPACFRINQRLNEAPCFYLNIVHGALDAIHYNLCLKEMTIPSSHHPTSHAIATTSHNNNGVPHSVYAKTCQYDDSHDVEVTFLSKNLDLDGVILAYPKITRDGKLISFSKDTRIIDKPPIHEHNRLMDAVAMGHIEVYADVMHGIGDQRHIVTVVEKKSVKTTTTDMVYQLNTHVRSSDEPHHEMCCNVLLHTKWHGRFDYEPFCGQVACFKPLEGLGTCAYLNMEHQINPYDFQSCWKEVK